MFLNTGAVGGHDHFQYGAVLEVLFHFLHGQNVAVKLLGQH